ncbi:MAG: DUF4892 domain-containing protein [Gammaproteobacteria bacterium HGW-Gammaproteobacteria-6]|nr:MAG: DUF4892 domain-containing protein [Gammaproteobacteria bacterium HGW-Gammaproteobacteria-6]
MSFLPRYSLAMTAVLTACFSLVYAIEPDSGLVINAFPRAELVNEIRNPSADHVVVFGSIRRINNQLRAEREVRASGDLIRATFEIPAGHERTEAFNHAKSQLLAMPHRMLFFCEGRECGSSSLWANQVLDNARLYGPEENQAYLVVRLDEAPQRFVSLYAITRGNRRVYLHVDQFTPEQSVDQALYPTASTLLKVLQAEGELALPVEFGEQGNEVAEAWLGLVNRMMRSDIRLRLTVNGAQAPEVVSRLIELGIRDQRLEIGVDQPATGILFKVI